ncbi:hypothetical protein CFC21_088105 [Triticum aestivum]|uniref:Uncharacterized protein n=3 Tax=Triticinae TaxID=1648030 RepID=A0A453D2B3_AEGTS|nr:uncharacterized protein LOC109745450 [Aegilops tauschii subsp. strangulata]XP_044328940.1 uncharacterized protein LOC123050172 [Triticum aestivum]KAF7084498.1 hypothetical protein CFC21_088105 [Triticum aestivum]
MDQMEVDQPQPHHQSEKQIFHRCVTDKTRDFRAKSYGTLIQPYEFSCSQNGVLGEKHGFIHYSNKAIAFAGNPEEGFHSTEVQKLAATFLVENELPFNQLDSIGLNPEIDIGIVKTHGVAYNREIARTVTAYAHIPQSVDSWLNSLSIQGSVDVPTILKDSIRDLYDLLERLWDKNMTVDDVHLSGTYGLNGDMMQIKPSHVRVRNLGDARRPSQGLADMIFHNILNRWTNDVELSHFHQFLLNTNICKEDVLNHPFLGGSGAREGMYKELFRRNFTQRQKDWLQNNINTQGWQVRVDPADPNTDFGFREIMIFQKINKWAQAFEPNTWGALHFAKIAVSHYHEHDPVGRPQLDAKLKDLLPGLLVGVYGATFNPDFVKGPG